MKIYFLFLIVLAVAFEVVADILFKYWSINAKSVLIVGGIILYVIATGIWAYSLRFELLSKGITVFTVINLVSVVLVGVFIADVEREKYKSNLLYFQAEESKKRIKIPQGKPWGLIPFMFDEHLSLINKIGILFGVISVVLVQV